ncbi:hypothetical protein [Sporosarcina sp. FA9]|uniref:hypothetical protein n=1 Tax=Sporosarcina sp. FA9 TaxID=3413030 RepID=UPI003F659FE1
MKKRKYTLFVPTFLILLLLTGCNGQKETKVVEVLQEDTGVVTIEGHNFTQTDMDFYTLMQKVKHELNRAKNAESLKGAALEDSNSYWESQNHQYENINAQLQNLIEIYSMSLLAKEKHFSVPDDKLEQEITSLYTKIKDHTVIQEMINEYGEENYKLNIRQYVTEKMLSDRVVSELEKTVRSENPDASEQEIKYEVITAYDELVMDHISGLEIGIHLTSSK